MSWQRIYRYSVGALALLGLLMLVGCGGGGSSVKLQEPGDNGDFGSIGGTIFSLAVPQGETEAFVDYPNFANVTLTQLDRNTLQPLTGGYQASTTSSIMSSYQFANVPNGIYAITATVTSPYDATQSLTNTVTGIEVKNGNPTLMANILLGEDYTTFTGTVTEGGANRANAVVTIAVQAKPYDRTTDKIAVILHTMTDANGHYAQKVPTGAIDYVLNAYSDTSDFTDDLFVESPLTPEKLVNNFALNTTSEPVVLPLTLYHVSITLPMPTPQGSSQAQISRLAIARAANAPAAQITTLENKIRSAANTRAAGAMGSVENELTWSQDDLPNTTHGYYVYRATALSAPFIKIGQTMDYFQTQFTDNDPALTFETPVYYTATSYAANGLVSPAAKPVKAVPFLPFTNVSPGSLDVDGPGEVVHGDSATLSWDPVPDAKGYIVLLYRMKPTYNALPETPITISDGRTSVTIPQGTYWWNVSAYDTKTTDPRYTLSATRIAYSAFRKLVVMPD